MSSSTLIGRLVGVVVVFAVTGVAMFAIYASVAIAIEVAGSYFRTGECPDFSTYTLPDECLAHMGDWIRGEENDGKSDFVWFGSESDLNVCVQAFDEKQDAEFEAVFDANPECWDRYGNSGLLTRYDPKMEYRGRLLDDTDMRMWGFVTPTPSR